MIIVRDRRSKVAEQYTSANMVRDQSPVNCLTHPAAPASLFSAQPKPLGHLAPCKSQSRHPRLGIQWIRQCRDVGV